MKRKIEALLRKIKKMNRKGVFFPTQVVVIENELHKILGE